MSYSQNMKLADPELTSRKQPLSRVLWDDFQVDFSLCEQERSLNWRGMLEGELRAQRSGHSLL